MNLQNDEPGRRRQTFKFLKHYSDNADIEGMNACVKLSLKIQFLEIVVRGITAEKIQVNPSEKLSSSLEAIIGRKMRQEFEFQTDSSKGFIASSARDAYYYSKSYYLIIGVPGSAMLALSQEKCLKLKPTVCSVEVVK